MIEASRRDAKAQRRRRAGEQERRREGEKEKSIALGTSSNALSLW
jgi:hypothetical protein